VVVYLSQWFTRADRAKATCNFFAAVPLSLAIGSPVAGWILGQSWHGIQGWRWLFVVEGFPAIVLGVIATLYLTDRPRDAAWLREDERRWIETTLQREAPPARGNDGAMRTVIDAFNNPLVLLLGGTAFLQYFMGYSVVFFLPIMLKRLSSLPDVQVGILGALPYLAAFATVVIMGWNSDRSQERRWHCAIPQFVAAAALVGLSTQPRSIALVVTLLAIVSATSLCFVPIFWSLSTELLGPSGAAAVGLINTIASVAGFAGPVAFGTLSTRTGSYASGLVLIAALAVAAGLMVLTVPRARQPVPHTI
jgi:ACS family tartrate transporter-like MFS transporter